MDAKFAQLFLRPDNLNGLNNDAVVAYLVMRADIITNETSTARMAKNKGELTSGYSVQSIATRSRLSLVGAQRALEELLRKPWIKAVRLTKEDTVYQLGTIDKVLACSWYSDVIIPKEVELSETDKIRAMLIERKSRVDARKELPSVRISPDAKRAIACEALGDLTKVQKGSTQFIRHFSDCYTRAYGLTPPDLTGKIDAKYYTYANRFIRECSNDLDKALKLVSWIFENWDRISILTKYYEKPNINFICTVKIITSCKNWMFGGFPSYEKLMEKLKASKGDVDGVGHRADAKRIAEAPDIGW